MKALAAVLVGSVLIFGPGKWEAPLPGRFEILLPGDSRVAPIHVRLYDATGLVLWVSAKGTAGGGQDLAGRSEELNVEFTSGQCDDYADLTFKDSAGGYQLTVRTSSALLDGGSRCEFFLIGVSRSLTLRLRQPIAVASVTFDRR